MSTPQVRIIRNLIFSVVRRVLERARGRELGTTPDCRRAPALSYQDDLAGQRLRKPLSGNEPLTMAMLARRLSPPAYHPGYSYFFVSALHEGYVRPYGAYAYQESCKMM